MLSFEDIDLLCGECRARSACTNVLSDLALLTPLSVKESPSNAK